jgi:hypothetical protein
MLSYSGAISSQLRLLIRLVLVPARGVLRAYLILPYLPSVYIRPYMTTCIVLMALQEHDGCVEAVAVSVFLTPLSSITVTFVVSL